MRYVGQNGIAVAVPADWETSSGSCQGHIFVINATPGSSISACVWFSGVGEVAIADDQSTGLNDRGTTIRLGGVPVLRFGPAAPTVFTEGTPPWYAILSSNQNNVGITISGSTRRMVKRIVDSAVAIPPGYTTVPSPRQQLEIDDLGFTLHRITRLDNDLPPHTFLGFIPASGTVVPAGSPLTAVYSRTDRGPRGCSDGHVVVRSPTEMLEITTRNAPYRLHIHVGDVVALQVTGCGTSHVDLKSANHRILHGSANSLTAVAVGHVWVAVRWFSCSQGTDRSCARPTYFLGKVTVRIAQ